MPISFIHSSSMGWLLVFPVCFCLTILPYIRWSFHRVNQFSLHRAIFYSLFVGYLVSVVTLTLFPLPVSPCTTTGVGIQNIFFSSIISAPISEAQLLIGTSNISIRSFIQTIGANKAISQVVLNMLLFIPLGLLSTYLWHRSWKRIMVIAFSFSLFLELQQLTGVRGLFDCAHRLFDVDDLLLNTLGALMGWRIMTYLHIEFPHLARKKTSLQEQHMQKRFCTWITNFSIRRACIGIYILSNGTQLIQVGRYTPFVTVSLLLFTILQVIIPLSTHGKTLGHYMTGSSLHSGSRRRIGLYQILISLPSVFLILILTATNGLLTILWGLLLVVFLTVELYQVIRSHGTSTHLEKLLHVKTTRENNEELRVKN